MHACFISYRHTNDDGATKHLFAFREELKTQLSLFMPNCSIFFDEDRLKLGDMIDAKLARELCRSACMIMIYNPLYFDIHNPYCAREYKAMLGLEQRRMKDIKNESAKNGGLIFPVIFRGSDYLPDEIKKVRLCKSFEYANAPGDFKNKKSRESIRSLAELVFNRYALLSGTIDPKSSGCDSFQLPDAKSIQTWLHEIAPVKPVMPGY